MEFVLFIVGLILLIKAADYFVDSSTKIAKIFKISEIIIGATIVSLGTTLPEVLVSATGALKGMGAMAYGNAIGSIICNTSLISALTLAFLPGNVDKKTLKKPIIFFFFAFTVYLIIAIVFKRFNRFAGFILFLIFVLFVINVIIDEKKKVIKIEKKIKKEIEDDKINPINQFIILIVSAIVVAIGANLLVDNGTKIAVKIGVPTSVVALTMVALGTSLPELVTAITAIKKGHRELSIGNIIGANFLNIVTVTGIAAMVKPFEIPTEKMIKGINASFVVDIPVAFIVMLILCIPPIIKGKTFRWQGVLLLVIYVIYLMFQYIGSP